MANIYVQDWSEGDESNNILKKILRALLSPLLGQSAFSTRPYQISTTPSSSAARTTNATVETLTAGQVLNIQNLDTDVLYVKRGAGASATDFNYVLKAGAGAADGSGGSVVISDWIGPVSVFGTTPSYSAWK